jgi:RNA recognition motif-containing protein
VKNTYVGNLSFEATEESVRALFEAYGTVGRVNIVTDRDTGQPRGFGFVEMANDGEGEKAIAAVNGTELGGRALNVNEARPKAERSGGGGGFGRKRW